MDESLLYVFDPLCGWCNAFHPHLRQVVKETKLPVTGIAGGLFRGDRIQSVSAYPFIADTMDDLEKRTGVMFGPAFRAAAKAGDYVVDSEAAGRAFVALRHLAPDRAVEAIGALHEAVFVHALDLREPTGVAWAARRMGLDEGQAIARFLRDESATEAQDDVAAAQHLGVTGFPALILVRDGHGFLVATGWTPAADVLHRIADARARPLPEADGHAGHDHAH
ncbi:MAG: DsbA family protein [Candidatus Thermoplasmatota archaeon]